MSAIKQGQKHNILVVDDEEKICKLVKAFLDQTNMFGNIVIADSVSTALLKIRNEEFDLLIVDYKMPQKTGIDLVELLKNSFKTRKIKVLMISGFVDNHAITKAINIGIHNILVKPFTRASLVQKVMEILSHSL